MSIHELGEKLAKAGRLKLHPLCIYGGSDEISQDAIPSYAIGRCIARAVYTASLFEDTPQLYVERKPRSVLPWRNGLDGVQ